MRNAIIVSVVVVIAGTAIYRLVDGSTPFPTGQTKPITVETPRLDEVRLVAASPDGPRVPLGNLIIIRPPPEPDIVTGSVKPAKLGQAAKAKTQTPPQAKQSNAPARKQAQPRRLPNSPTTDAVTMATPFVATSAAE